jgi:TPR repeat protein
MSYTIDKNLEAGMNLLAEGKKIDAALKLINKSARKGTTRGKSFFEVGKIIREGIPGLEPNVEESRKYYDAALSQFFKEPCDSMDYREMGDYFYFGLGTEPVNKNRALEYYDLAAKDGDEVAKERADQIRKESEKGSANAAPALTPVTEVKEEKPAEKTEEKAEAETPKVTVAPVVAPEAKPVVTENKAVNEEIDADQLLIKAIRLLDNAASSEEDKRDGIELADAACDQGSMRAAVLMGFLNEGVNELLKTDYDAAKKYYEIGIERGSSNAEFRLGLLYLNTACAFHNDEKGHQLILDSARKGYPYALNYLGDCFRIKVTDPKNLDIAYRYYALAGERGLGLGYHNMAEIDSSRQNVTLATQHEQYAAENGYDPEAGEQDPLYCNLHL